MMIIVLFMFFGIAYAILIGLFISGWLKLPVFWATHKARVKLSVIVPVKNEAGNLKALLEALNFQKYPKEFFEVIIVNDHSTDSGLSVVQSEISRGTFPNLRLIDSASYGASAGKKYALELGISHARFDYIVTTDADCIMGRHWLETIACFIEKELPDMVIGPVSMIPGKTLFSQMQVLEFMSLTGTTIGAAALGLPIMCNGANLVFRKELFEKAGGYSGNHRYASGDDMFLLQKFKKMQGINIRPMKSHGAMVFTKPEVTLAGFLQQRGRWSGKFPGFQDAFIVLSGLLAGCTSILIVAGFLAGLHASAAFEAAIFLLIFKSMVDFALLWSVSGFLGKRQLLLLFPALAVIYPLYVVVAIGKGVFTATGWK